MGFTGGGLEKESPRSMLHPPQGVPAENNSVPGATRELVPSLLSPGTTTVQTEWSKGPLHRTVTMQEGCVVWMELNNMVLSEKEAQCHTQHDSISARRKEQVNHGILSRSMCIHKK